MKTSFTILLSFLASTGVNVLARLGDQMPNIVRRLPHFITWDSTYLDLTCGKEFELFGEGNEYIKVNVDAACESSGFVKIGRGGRVLLQEKNQHRGGDRRRLEDGIPDLTFATLYEASSTSGGNVLRAFDGVVDGTKIVVVQMKKERRRRLQEEGHRQLEDAFPFTVLVYLDAYLGWYGRDLAVLKSENTGTELRDADDFDHEFQARSG